MRHTSLLTSDNQKSFASVNKLSGMIEHFAHKKRVSHFLNDATNSKRLLYLVDLTVMGGGGGAPCILISWGLS